MGYTARPGEVPVCSSGNRRGVAGVWMVNGAVEGCPLDERAAVDLARAGDLDAYADLVRRHQSMALRVAYVVCRDRQEAEDIVQESFVKAHRALGRFRVEAPFRPWLLRIVRNEALNHVRKHGRQGRLVDALATEVVSGDAAPSPETLVVAERRRRALVEAVDALPDRFRDVVTCRYLIELSEAETARVLGIPAGTVKSRTARAITRLRDAPQLQEEREHG